MNHRRNKKINFNAGGRGLLCMSEKSINFARCIYILI